MPLTVRVNRQVPCVGRAGRRVFWTDGRGLGTVDMAVKLLESLASLGSGVLPAPPSPFLSGRDDQGPRSIIGDIHEQSIILIIITVAVGRGEYHACHDSGHFLSASAPRA